MGEQSQVRPRPLSQDAIPDKPPPFSPDNVSAGSASPPSLSPTMPQSGDQQFPKVVLKPYAFAAKRPTPPFPHPAAQPPQPHEFVQPKPSIAPRLSISSAGSGNVDANGGPKGVRVVARKKAGAVRTTAAGTDRGQSPDYGSPPESKAAIRASNASFPGQNSKPFFEQESWWSAHKPLPSAHKPQGQNPFGNFTAGNWVAPSLKKNESDDTECNQTTNAFSQLSTTELAGTKQNEPIVVDLSMSSQSQDQPQQQQDVQEDDPFGLTGSSIANETNTSSIRPVKDNPWTLSKSKKPKFGVKPKFDPAAKPAPKIRKHGTKRQMMGRDACGRILPKSNVPSFEGDVKTNETEAKAPPKASPVASAAGSRASSSSVAGSEMPGWFKPTEDEQRMWEWLDPKLRRKMRRRVCSTSLNDRDSAHFSKTLKEICANMGYNMNVLYSGQGLQMVLHGTIPTRAGLRSRSNSNVPRESNRARKKRLEEERRQREYERLSGWAPPAASPHDSAITIGSSTDGGRKAIKRGAKRKGSFGEGSKRAGKLKIIDDDDSEAEEEDDDPFNLKEVPKSKPSKSLSTQQQSEQGNPFARFEKHIPAIEQSGIGPEASMSSASSPSSVSSPGASDLACTEMTARDRKKMFKKRGDFQKVQSFLKTGGASGSNEEQRSTVRILNFEKSQGMFSGGWKDERIPPEVGDAIEFFMFDVTTKTSSNQKSTTGKYKMNSRTGRQCGYGRWVQRQVVKRDAKGKSFNLCDPPNNFNQGRKTDRQYKNLQLMSLEMAHRWRYLPGNPKLLTFPAGVEGFGTQESKVFLENAVAGCTQGDAKFRELCDEFWTRVRIKSFWIPRCPAAVFDDLSAFMLARSFVWTHLGNTDLWQAINNNAFDESYLPPALARSIRIANQRGALHFFSYGVYAAPSTVVDEAGLFSLIFFCPNEVVGSWNGSWLWKYGKGTKKKQYKRDGEDAKAKPLDKFKNYEALQKYALAYVQHDEQKGKDVEAFVLILFKLH